VPVPDQLAATEAELELHHLRHDEPIEVRLVVDVLGERTQVPLRQASEDSLGVVFDAQDFPGDELRDEPLRQLADSRHTSS
jgi:hypothetical protein